MNNSRAPSKVRVIRLDEWPTPSAGGGAPAPIDPPVRAASPSAAVASALGHAQPWPSPIGSAGRQGAAVPATPPAAEPTLRLVSPVPPLPPEDAPTLRRLPRGEVKAWPVRVGVRTPAHVRLGAGWTLLVLATAGLALPWAYTAARRHLWRHTRVAGLSMDDHHPALAQLLHWLMGLGLAAGVALSWRSDPLLGLGAASLALLTWPVWLFLYARRRAHHLSWARRRMGFDGQWAQVYREVWPLVGGALVVMWGLAAAARWGRPEGWCLWGLSAAGWAMALPLAAWGWLDWRQRHLRVGPWSLWWSVPREGLVSVFWRAVVWTTLAALFMAGLTAVVWAVLRACQVPLSWWGHVALLAAPACLVGVAAHAYVQARLQNLVWGKTGNRLVRLQSRLDVGGYVQQQCGHAVLMMLTLGLYWPWAQAATHRMRLQAITVWARVEAEDLRAHWPVHRRAP